MTFSAELAVWLVVSGIALITSGLSLRLAHQILCANSDQPQDVREWSEHLREKRAERLLFWLLLFAIGILAMWQAPPTQEPVGSVSIVGQLIRWCLIGTIVLGCYETATDFLFTWKQWHRVSKGGT